MDMDTFLVFTYGGVAIALLLRAGWLDEKLKRYIDKHYPEEGKVIRSYQWQWYPWSVGRRTLRTLIRKQCANDPELVRRARKAKRAVIYFIAWPIFTFLIDSFIY